MNERDKAQFLFLGTGASAGVPLIGCSCKVCTSSSPKDKRFRPSGLLSVGDKKLLIDIGPDFRSQALRFSIDSIDALLLTHTHFDHIAGIDEIRVFNIRRKKALPVLLSKESFLEVKKRYDYLFSERLSAKIEPTVLEKKRGEIDFLGLRIGYFQFFQSHMKVTGFRLGDFAYICDIQRYDDSIFFFLKGVRFLVLSALRPEGSAFHLSFEDVIEFSRKVGAERTYITHLGHFMLHDEMNRLLPDGIEVGYDGLKWEFHCNQ